MWMRRWRVMTGPLRSGMNVRTQWGNTLCRPELSPSRTHGWETSENCSSDTACPHGVSGTHTHTQHTHTYTHKHIHTNMHTHTIQVSFPFLLLCLSHYLLWLICFSRSPWLWCNSGKLHSRAGTDCETGLQSHWSAQTYSHLVQGYAIYTID